MRPFDLDQEKKEIFIGLEKVIKELSLYQLNEGSLLEKEFKKNLWGYVSNNKTN